MRHIYSKDPVIDRSLRHSVRDGVAYSVMVGAGETYFSAYALLFGATTAQIGILASLPLLLGAMVQPFSAWLGRRIGARKGIIVTGACLQASLWIPLIVLPIVFGNAAVGLLITVIVLYHAAANLTAPQWNSLMGDLVPPRRRGRYFARRTRLASATAFVALLGAGAMLYVFSRLGMTLTGYIGIFAIAGLARWVSAFHLSRMYDPPGKVAALDLPHFSEWRRRLRNSPFVRFSIFFALMQFSVAIASPFFTVYMLRDLHLNYLEFTAIASMSVLIQFLTLNTWGRLGDVFGNRIVLVLTGFMMPLLPGLWLLSAQLWYLMLVQVAAGFVWAGFSLSGGNFLYDLVPAEKRASYMAAHNLLTGAGIFLGALLGGYLGQILPQQAHLAGISLRWDSALLGVFLISGLARLTVAGLFLRRIREVRPARPTSVSHLIFRATRFNALAGFVYDVVSSRPRQDTDSPRRKRL